MFLHLCHVQPSELSRRSALSEQTDGGPLSEPLGQPGQVTVTVQVVGVETAVQRRKDKRRMRHDFIQRSLLAIREAKNRNTEH